MIPVAVLSIAAPLIVIKIALAHADPILKQRVVETLRARFGSEVQLDHMQVNIAHGIEVSGGGLRIFPPDEVRTAGYNTPEFVVEHFDFHASVLGLVWKPTHVGQVNVRGLEINIPPGSLRQKAGGHKRHMGQVKIRVDRIVCDDSRLVIGTDKPNKDPRVFLLKHIVLRDLGPNTGWPFDAVLTNPVPNGEIHAIGTFGPWNTVSAGDSKVQGMYIFDHADMNTIKGIGGTLHSTGSFNGQLNRINVSGTTQVPDFSLDTANHPMPLETEFQAVVDGTTGDTYLNSITAKLGGSTFSCQGEVVDVKGKGHRIEVNTEVPDGQIADFLGLAVKSDHPMMTGRLNLQAKLQIAPGKQSVPQKMTMQGAFKLRQIHFTNPKIQDKVDLLSKRAQGDTDNLNPGAPDVTSTMTGKFAMGKGELRFPSLHYSLPGGKVNLTGHYTMDGRQYEFKGNVQTRVKVSEMVASKWKQVLLKPLDLFLSKNGGANVPVKVTSGKDGKPKFGFRF